MEKTITYRIWFDDTTGIVRMQWTGYATSAQFREGTRDMLRVLKEHSASAVLGDITDMVLISQEDQQWLVECFLPVAIESGFKSVALLKPHHYFNKVAVETVAYKVNQDLLSIRFFDDEAAALEWLRSRLVKN